jgi:hypothetical protein
MFSFNFDNPWAARPIDLHGVLRVPFLVTIGWVLGFLASSGPIARADDRARPTPTFAKVVQENFPHWDLNHDGRLESSEVDQLMNRKGIHRDAAAALATIKRYERSETEEQRNKYAPSEEELVSNHLSEGPVQPLDPAAGKPQVYHFETHFHNNLKMLASINRQLYAGKGPNFTAMHQGPIGDCYFFCITGYLAARYPERITRMIIAEQDGSYLVHFGDGEKFRVPAPTDAEILVNNSGSSLEDGLWLPVLEKAIGEKMRQAAKSAKRTVEATDAMAHGGSPKKVMQWYTGHEAIDIKLRDPTQERTRLSELRRLLPQTLERRELASVSMGKQAPANQANIPHLGYHHAYAIFAYDRNSDEVTLWNPWGNNVTPKGPAGIHYGFPTNHGIFKVPLKTLYEQFSSVHLETSKPLPAGK